MRRLTVAELRTKWPKLRPGNYNETSPATARYNCVAFVNDDERHWWQAGMYGGMYSWPATIEQSDSLTAWVQLFTSRGFELTDSRDHEPGFEKVAIYIDPKDGLPSHVTKSDGRVWKSKLGKLQDIEHASLDLLEGNTNYEYGVVDKILKKKAGA